MIARRVLRVLLYVLLQGKEVLCHVLSFGVERAGRLHHLLEVIRAGSSGRSSALGSSMWAVGDTVFKPPPVNQSEVLMKYRLRLRTSSALVLGLLVGFWVVLTVEYARLLRAREARAGGD